MSFQIAFIREGIIHQDTLTKVLPEANTVTENPALEFSGQRCLQRDECCEVYFGVLRQEGLRDKDAVCKLAWGDRLSGIRHEAKLYNDRLGPLQGKYVPRCYGYFEGVVHFTRRRSVDAGCLILEYCGERLTSESPLIHEESIRLKAAMAILAIHRCAGLQHNDLLEDGWNQYWPHVLVRDTRDLIGRVQDMAVRIVDFDLAEDHKCEAMPIRQWDYQPTLMKFNCDEMHQFLKRLDIWTPTYVEFFGCRYSIFRAPTVYRLVKCVQTQSAHRLPPVPKLKELARGILDDYYACFEERFAVIGHPFSHRVPLNIPGVPEPDESAILASGDWTIPEHNWDSRRLT